MKRALSIFIFFVFSFSLVRVCFATGYSYQRQISACQNSKCPANQSNYTVLICANETLGNGNSCPSVSGLNQSGGGAHVTNSNGYDIVFSTTVCTAPTLMKWEMEKYVASTGEMVAHVLITSLLSSGNTLYICYGNSGISSFQGGSTGSAWNSNYAAVYHLPDGSSLTANDSTTNGNNGVITSAGATTGQIDGGANFNGAGKYIHVTSSTSLNITADVSLETWVYPNNFTNYNTLIVRTDGTNKDYAIYTVASNQNQIYLGFGHVETALTISPGFTVSTWNHVVVTDTAGVMVVYINGVSAGTTTLSRPNGSTNDVWLGEETGNKNSSNTVMDESRIVSTALSANWVTTDYNNQSSPSTFESFGTETSFVVGGAVNLFFFSFI